MEDFLNDVGVKVETKLFKLLRILSHEGPDLKRPYADFLREGIRELRVIFSSNQYRALYFFFHGDNIVVTHGFMKKTDEVPSSEIERALRYRKDFEERVRKGGIKL